MVYLTLIYQLKGTFWRTPSGQWSCLHLGLSISWTNRRHNSVYTCGNHVSPQCPADYLCKSTMVDSTWSSVLHGFCQKFICIYIYIWDINNTSFTNWCKWIKYHFNNLYSLCMFNYKVIYKSLWVLYTCKTLCYLFIYL